MITRLLAAGIAALLLAAPTRAEGVPDAWRVG
jgi:hypothetical protein